MHAMVHKISNLMSKNKMRIKIGSQVQTISHRLKFEEGLSKNNVE